MERLSQIEVIRITTDQCYDLRQRVLRPGQDLNLCRFAEDDLPTTFHLGVSYNEKIIANGTFMIYPTSHFPKANLPYRLRGMATDPAFQKMHLGQKILNSAEQILRDKNCDLLWFNARLSAFGFYEKCGFNYSGDLFDIPGVGPHKVMHKHLYKLL